MARYGNQGNRTYLSDALGSVLALSDDTQTTQTIYSYSPYGEQTQTGVSDANAVQYTGRETDGTGLDYYRARYYDPQLKRFVTSDPIGLGGGLNTYAYVHGNSVRRFDPSGLIEEETMAELAERPTTEEIVAAKRIPELVNEIQQYNPNFRTPDSARPISGRGARPNNDDIDSLEATLQSYKNREIERQCTNTTRNGVIRTNPADWRALRNLWDELGYGDILSPANRQAIAQGRTPTVDEAWARAFPEDAGLMGERIPMHHIQGSPITVPLPETRHLDAHMPGGYRDNPGGPGSAVPFY